MAESPSASRPGRQPTRRRRGTWIPGLGILVLAVAGMAMGRLGPGEARVSYGDGPAIRLPMPPAPVVAAAGPPVEPDPALLEPSELGPLPRIAADGPEAWRVYTRQGGPACTGTCLAVIVTGLGLAHEPMVRALDLPPEVGLAFSPYAEDLAGWQARARAAGHEALLELPLRPARYPEDDAGPLALAPDLPPGQQERALLAVLAAGTGYPAVVAPAGAFAADPARLAPVARALRERGVGFVELGGRTLAAVSGEAGLAYAAAEVPGGDGAVDEAALEALAAGLRDGGRAVVAMPPTPTALGRLEAWLETLKGQGIALVPPGGFLGKAAAPVRVGAAGGP
jgi:polysaccharide deacetylase 2 family uncharacterized protein YibQ